MISANATPTRTPSRRLYAWLAAGLLIFLGVAMILNSLQTMPESTQDNERIERIQREQQCQTNEIVVVVEFAPHVYKAYCAAKG